MAEVTGWGTLIAMHLVFGITLGLLAGSAPSQLPRRLLRRALPLRAFRHDRGTNAVASFGQVVRCARACGSVSRVPAGAVAMKPSSLSDRSVRATTSRTVPTWSASSW